jgi:hypothetical protein
MENLQPLLYLFMFNLMIALKLKFQKVFCNPADDRFYGSRQQKSIENLSYLEKEKNI